MYPDISKSKWIRPIVFFSLLFALPVKINCKTITNNGAGRALLFSERDQGVRIAEVRTPLLPGFDSFSFSAWLVVHVL